MIEDMARYRFEYIKEKTTSNTHQNENEHKTLNIE